MLSSEELFFTPQLASLRGTHSYTWVYKLPRYGPTRVLFFNRELQIPDHYLRPISESYINI